MYKRLYALYVVHLTDLVVYPCPHPEGRGGRGEKKHTNTSIELSNIKFSLSHEAFTLCPFLSIRIYFEWVTLSAIVV